MIDFDAAVPARRLALAVLRQAVKDADDPRLTEAVRHEARTFLACDTWERRLWCALADAADYDWRRSARCTRRSVASSR